MVLKLNSKAKRGLLLLVAINTVAAVMLLLYFRPVKSLRTHMDCLNESSSILGNALNTYYDKHRQYFSSHESGSRYCNAEQLQEDGLQIANTLKHSAATTGRNIEFRGKPIDPFRKSLLFEDEEQASCWYYHSASAEFWIRIKGYPLRYYCSKDRKWALIISNGPDGDVDVTKEQLDLLQPPAEFLYEQLYESLIPFAFRLGDCYEKPGFDEDIGPYTSGDIFVLLYDGKRAVINP